MKAQHDDQVSLTPLQREVADRFGVLPNFFRLTPESPEITRNLWGFARFAYLDNPLPSVFKERLFVYLSRFCPARYCIARHVGFLMGRGRPAGDAAAALQSADDVIRLISRPLARGDAARPHIEALAAVSAPLPHVPERDSALEESVFVCASHVFTQSHEAPAALHALRHAFGEPRFQYLTVLLTFIRTAHYWTRVHPELSLEEDVNDLLSTYETLAECVLNDPEASACEVSPRLLDELHSLRRERVLHEGLERANEILRQTEERLREQDRRKDEWLATLAHELRNPLAPIRSGIEILKLSPTPETAAEASEMMERQLGQLVRLVDDLLDVSRISRGKIELKKERIDLATIVQQAIESVRPLCQQLGHEITVTLPPQPLMVQADSVRLTQVVVNLLNNACKFTEPRGHVRLSLEQSEGQAVIRVRDTGIGIEPERVREIFELFTQLDTSIERSRSGLGIGLTLVKQLAELHGGSVEAHSEGVGRGSEFVVRLPLLLEAQQPLVAGAAPRGRAGSAKRILVVDDNRDAANSLGLLLKLSGHEVHCVYDGPEAVEAAAQLRPHLVLLDIGLPRMNGYDVAARIRAQPYGREMLLVAVTGWGQATDRQRSVEVGFDLHLVKPIDHGALGELLERFDANERVPGPRARVTDAPAGGVTRPH